MLPNTNQFTQIGTDTSLILVVCSHDACALSSSSFIRRVQHPGASEPDLPFRARLGADVAHVHHRRRERAGCEVPDRAVGAATVEQLLVQVQEPLMGEQVGVVGVVERGG
jgi:hypothetical protein